MPMHMNTQDLKSSPSQCSMSAIMIITDWSLTRLAANTLFVRRINLPVQDIVFTSVQISVTQSLMVG